MTRRIMSSQLSATDAASEREPQNSNPEYDGLEAPNPKFAHVDRISLPATCHHGLDPISTNESELSVLNSSKHPSEELALIASKSTESKSANTDVLSAKKWSIHPDFAALQNDHEFICSYPACRDNSTGKPKVFHSYEDKLRHDEVLHTDDWACSFPSCVDKHTGKPKTFRRREHKLRHELTVHFLGEYNCYYHGARLKRFCIECPEWAVTLSSWKPTPVGSLPMSNLRHHTIPATHGFALPLKPGAHLRIVDLEGQQVVDFMAWALPFLPDSSCEHFSASYTRYRIGGSAPPQVGECLYSNKDRPMFEILEDKVKCHDMLFMACNPSFYERLGKPAEHRSCASNIAEAMFKLKMPLVDGKKGAEGWSGVHDPFNVFQNTPYYSLKALECSRKGDHIEMRVSKEMEKGVVVALSSCPYEENGFNGGKVTDVGVVWEEL